MPPYLPFGIGTKAINPRGPGGLVPQDTFGNSILHHYPSDSFFHFTLNQNSGPF